MNSKSIFNKETNINEIRPRAEKEIYQPKEKPEYREQAQKLINEQLEYSDHAQMGILEDNINSLDAKAGEIRDEFESNVKELFENKHYTEEGKKERHNILYSETREKLMDINNEYQEKIKEYDHVVSKASQSALDKLKKSSTVNDIKENDFMYIQTMLDRDDSLKTKYDIAEKYNFNQDVLTVLNASGQKVNNLIESNINQLSRYQGNRDLTGTAGKNRGVGIVIKSRGDVFQQISKSSTDYVGGELKSGIFY